MRKIGIMISILLLLIGNVNAENNTYRVSNDTSNTSIDYMDVGPIDTAMINEDVDARETENVVIDNGDIMPTGKKSSPGFESIIVIITFLFAIYRKDK